MKRIMSVILAVAVLSVLAVLPVSAANDFAISITNTDATVTVGDTFEVVITVEGVSAGKEIGSILFDVVYNSAYLKPEYTQSAFGDNTRYTATPGNTEWEHMITNNVGNYSCFLNPTDTGWNSTDGVLPSALSNGESLTITLPFTVLDAAAGQTVSVTIANAVAYEADDIDFATALTADVDAYTFTAASKNIPVTTIGAKINTNAPALRLGAKYEKAQLGEVSAYDVEDIGIVFYPTRFLAGSELTCETAGALKISAQGIEGFVDGNVFEDYDGFVFYVTIVNIPANGMDDSISYRSYLTKYERIGGETIYAENTYERSYESVYNAVFPSIGTGSGDNTILPGQGWFE